MGTESNDDVAEFEIFENGDAFEKGEMPNPANGNKVQAFEEVWGALPITSTEQPAWVLRRKDDQGITYLACVGSHYQALRKSTSGSFYALREEKVESTWETRYDIGGSILPSIRSSDWEEYNARSWSVGSEVNLGGDRYSVLAVEKISTSKL